jgi:hypothetical protein
MDFGCLFLPLFDGTLWEGTSPSSRPNMITNALSVNTRFVRNAARRTMSQNGVILYLTTSKKVVYFELVMRSKDWKYLSTKSHQQPYVRVWDYKDELRLVIKPITKNNKATWILCRVTNISNNRGALLFGFQISMSINTQDLTSLATPL